MGVGISDLRMSKVGEGIGVDRAVPSTSMRDSYIYCTVDSSCETFR